MKKSLAIILSILCILSLMGCGKKVETEPETPGQGQNYFNAVVLEVNNDMILVKCTECENGAISVENEVSIHMDTVSSEEVPILNVGDTIRVVYAGEVMETYPLQLQEVISIFWIDENGEIVTKGAEITEIKHEPSEKPEWGIELTVENITQSGLTIVCSQTHVDVSGELFTGSHYTISKHVDGEWKEVEYLPQENEVAWTDEAWIIPMDDQVKWNVNWGWLYGELSTGTYRIGKRIMNTEPGKLETAIYYAEFEITE